MNLFIYGTLAPGKPNEHILKDVKGQWLAASVRGDLVADGWGSELGFPGIVLNADGPVVNGLIFCSDELSQHLEMLDEFEGEGYQRVITRALLESGESVDTYIYQLA